MQIKTYPTANVVYNCDADIAVVIDVLRASTTICAALSNGALSVRPVTEVDEAFELKKVDNNAILGGERNALKVEGFDLGNSPLEYTRGTVEGRNVIMTTTNGTRAVGKASGADKVCIAGFVNLTSVSTYIKAASKDARVDIICSGTKGEFSLEDALCAGMLASTLNADKLCDFTLMYVEVYNAHRDELAEFARMARHARRLIAKGFGDDVAEAFTVDKYTVVPKLDADGCLRSVFIDKQGV